MSWADGGAPEGWKLRTLGEVAKVVGGGTPRTGVPGNFSDKGGHPWITPADLAGYEEKFISRGRRFLTDQGLATSSARLMPAGTVLFSSRAPIGYIAIATNPVTTNQGFRSFIPSAEIEPEYLYYVLRFIKPLAEQLASGTTFPEISGSKAARLPIAYPPLTEQRAIAAVLDKAGLSGRAAASHLVAASRAIERFRLGVITAASAGRLTADWREANPCSPVDPRPVLSGSALTNASGSPNTDDLIEVPETWALWPVESVTEKVIDYRGRTPPSASVGPIPHVRTTQIRDGRIDWATDRFVTQDIYDQYMTRGIPRPNDVLFTMEAPMGEVGIVDRDEPFSIAQRILLMRPGDRMSGKFLALALRSLHVRRAIEYRATGTGVLGVSYKRLRSVLLPVPPLDEQGEIARRVEQLLELADSLRRRIALASKQVDRSSQAVLAKAFRGELMAPQVPS